MSEKERFYSANKICSTKPRAQQLGSNFSGSSKVDKKEVRRQQQVEAAERRIKEQESRGIRDPERVRRMQQRSNEVERREQEAKKYDNSSGLKWRVN